MHMKSLLVGAIVLGDIDVANLKKTSAKSLYLGFTSSFHPPKVVFKYNDDWNQVWHRLQSPMLDPRAGEIFLLVINKDRLYNKFNTFDMSGNFPAHIPAESPSNISNNPSEVISKVSEPSYNF